ncbi:MAG: prenyltransferase/squalene oxidase repeat-containing protein [Spirosomataceae bacterium]
MISTLTLKKISISAVVAVAIYWGLLKPYLESMPAHPSKVRQAISNGKAFLKSIQKPNGAISDTVNPLFAIWETVLAAKALYGIDRPPNEPALLKAMKFLKENKNKDGLVCHNLKCREGYCIETSSLYLQLLIDLEGVEKVKAETGHIAGLQKNTGEWLVGNPDVRESRDFPSTTAFALAVLQKSNTQCLYPEQSVAWLISKQTKQGHWGNVWEYYDIPAYALWPMAQVLAPLTAPPIEEVKKKAVAYIIQSQNSDGAWRHEVSDFIRRPSAELQTALMLAAIQSFQENTADYSQLLDKASIKALNFLVSHQAENGSWEGGNFPIDSQTYEKEEYVFATSMALIVLQNYLDHL